MQGDGTLQRPSTTDGQTDVDRGSDEHKTSRQGQHHDTDPTPGVVAARWTNTAASFSTYHQPRDSTVREQGDAAATTHRQTNVD